MTSQVSSVLRVPISSDADIVTARHEGRALAAHVGFSSMDLTLIATAISELARNIVLYAGRGEIRLEIVERGGRRGIALLARDDGPGIADVAQAMRGGYSTSGGLGLGLPGVRRVMDELEIVSSAGRGTKVMGHKWMA